MAESSISRAAWSTSVLEQLDRLLQACVLQAHVAANPPEVEQVPAQRRTGEEAARVRAVRQRIAAPADAAEQGDGREIVGLRDADLRRLRGDLPGGRADVRPPQQQLGRNSLYDQRLDGRQRPWTDASSGTSPGLRPRRAASALRCLRASLEGPGSSHSVARYCVFACCTSSSESWPALNIFSVISRLRFWMRRVALGDVDAKQGRPVAEVEVRHLRAQQHLYVVLARDGGEIGGVGGFDAAPETPPEIQFPAHVEACLVAVEAEVGGCCRRLPAARPRGPPRR